MQITGTPCVVCRRTGTRRVRQMQCAAAGLQTAPFRRRCCDMTGRAEGVCMCDVYLAVQGLDVVGDLN
jgi:hypothetical protein